MLECRDAHAARIPRSHSAALSIHSRSGAAQASASIFEVQLEVLGAVVQLLDSQQRGSADGAADGVDPMFQSPPSLREGVGLFRRAALHVRHVHVRAAAEILPPALCPHDPILTLFLPLAPWPPDPLTDPDPSS